MLKYFDNDELFIHSLILKNYKAFEYLYVTLRGKTVRQILISCYQHFSFIFNDYDYATPIIMQVRIIFVFICSMIFISNSILIKQKHKIKIMRKILVT